MVCHKQHAVNIKKRERGRSGKAKTGTEGEREGKGNVRRQKKL